MSSEAKCVHFIGVGGVGMSGIARVASDLGMKVSGSDMNASRYTRQLEEANIPVVIGHDAVNVPADCDVVVVSTAIPESNPELIEAKSRGIRIWQRARMLAELGRGKKTLAAAGTHGKTTTSSMLATAVDALGLSPTFVVGGIVDAYQTNAVSGSGDYYVVEADESDGSFLNLSPYVALVTNVEADHLDHYVGGIDEIRETFLRFMSSVPEEGAVVVCGEDPLLVELAQRSGRRVVSYGFDESCDTCVSDYRTEGLATLFTLRFSDGRRIDCRLEKSPGRHNALNAAGVLSMLWALGEDVETAAAGLAGFSGVRRRFDLVGEAAGVTVVDDYAHHPTEVQATISAARALDFERVVVLFQPHRYSRTQSLAADFACAFDAADALLVMDVYAAGEAPIEGVSGKLIVDAVNERGHVGEAVYAPCKDAVVETVLETVRPGDLLITMGAGDVTGFGPRIVEALCGR
ncbi:MAG: UDP-N-acetylmuramate--L-alanine ligase [Slackia sp.]|nr:UDP-N-acetylmuramate--L-alanine ligase [Slackia sp.]